MHTKNTKPGQKVTRAKKPKKKFKKTKDTIVLSHYHKCCRMRPAVKVSKIQETEVREVLSKRTEKRIIRFFAVVECVNCKHKITLHRDKWSDKTAHALEKMWNQTIETKENSWALAELERKRTVKIKCPKLEKVKKERRKADTEAARRVRNTEKFLTVKKLQQQNPGKKIDVS